MDMVKRKGKRKDKGRLSCNKCGTSMRAITINLGETPVRGWRCPKDGEEVLHPEDAQKALLLNKLKKKGIKVKVGILNKAPYVRFPKEFIYLLKKGDEVIIKIISGGVMKLEILGPE